MFFQKAGEAKKAIRTLQGVREGIAVLDIDCEEAVAARASARANKGKLQAAAGAAAQGAPGAVPNAAETAGSAVDTSKETVIEAAKRRAAEIAASISAGEAPPATAQSTAASVAQTGTPDAAVAHTDAAVSVASENVTPESPVSRFVVFHGLFADPKPVLPPDEGEQVTESASSARPGTESASGKPAVEAKPADWIGRLEVFGAISGSALDEATGTLAVEFEQEDAAATCLEILHGRESFGKLIVGDFVRSGLGA